MEILEDLKYTADHEWIKVANDIVRVGITDFAQEALGDVVYVAHPEVGRVVAQGDVLGEVESTKSVSEVYAPVSGEVTAVNSDLESSPESLNAEPYGSGWLCEIRLTNAGELDGLLDAGAYRKLVAE